MGLSPLLKEHTERTVWQLGQSRFHGSLCLRRTTNQLIRVDSSNSTVSPNYLWGIVASNGSQFCESQRLLGIPGHSEGISRGSLCLNNQFHMNSSTKKWGNKPQKRSVMLLESPNLLSVHGLGATHRHRNAGQPRLYFEKAITHAWG